MGRQAGGWRIKLPPGRKIWIVRFTVNGKTRDLSTGRSDEGEAAEEAARIYADAIQRDPPKRLAAKRGDTPPMTDLLVEWLTTDGTIDADTVSTWECYARRYVEHFADQLHNVTEVTATAYRGWRLASVQASTVRKELSTLRRFLAWCRLQGYLQRDVTVPGVPSKATGTKHPQRRRVAAGDITPAHVAAFLAALPEWSTSRKVDAFPIRSRFIFAYETGLRPGAIDLLSVPQHWQPGSPTLRLTDDADKVRWGRELPLTEAAVLALTVAAPEAGPIFGAHDYRQHVAKAAALAMPPHLAATFTGAHLRSAITTHELEASGNLPGVQYLRGHKQATTTARYARPSMRAALDVHTRGRTANSGDGQ
jgi:integrase